MNHTWTVDYRDHSGNRYRFWRIADEESARFSYHPVTPEQSSSGVYSGGEPKAGTLDQHRVEALIEAVRALEANVEIHTTKRMMGTGSLRIQEGDGDPRRFLIGNGKHRQDFDVLLEPFR